MRSIPLYHYSRTWVVEGTIRGHGVLRGRCIHANVVDAYAHSCQSGITLFHVVTGTSSQETTLFLSTAGAWGVQQLLNNITASGYEVALHMLWGNSMAPSERSKKVPSS